MKVFTNILKILAALAAIAGAIYVVATYGDKIVAWAKKVWASLPCPECNETEAPAEAVVEEVAEEIPTENAVVEEPAAEIIVEENEPVAEDVDFAQ